LENNAAQAGFKQREYRGLLAEALADTTPDDKRLYRWGVYNLKGQSHVAFSRFQQPEDETVAAQREARRKAKGAKK
jgi:hypothetical protein